MKAIKHIYWASVLSLTTILVWILNGMEVIRYTILLLLEFPEKVIRVGAYLIGSAFTIAAFISEGGFWAILINVVLAWVIAFLLYSLCFILFRIAYSLIFPVMNFFNLEGIIQKLQCSLFDSLYFYVAYLDEKGPRKTDRLVFSVPWVIRRINSVLTFLSILIRICIYIGSIGLGIKLAWAEISEALNEAVTTLPKGFWFVACLLFVVYVVVFFYLGHCLAAAVKSAPYMVTSTDDLFAAYDTYDDFFRQYSYDNPTSGKDFTGRQNDPSQEPWKEETNISYNPYYSIMSAASSLSELKYIYRDLARQNHPDINTKVSPREANSQMIQINEAYAHFKTRFFASGNFSDENP